MRTMGFVAVAAVALFAGAALVRADDKKDEKKGIAYDLAHYFPIRALLAADKLDGAKEHEGVKDHAEKLARSEDKAIAKAGADLAKAKDIEAARKTFGDLSKALLVEIEAATKKGEKFRQVFVFDCSMTKPYGRWVQESKDIGNPYQGAKMPKCGKLLGTQGDEKCKDGCCDDEKNEEKKDGHKGHEHGHGDHKHE